MPALIVTQIYDIGTDSLRDITEADVERWKTNEAFAGIRIPMLRAMAVAERKLWNKEITLEQLYNAKRVWIELLKLDDNGKEKIGRET